MKYLRRWIGSYVISIIKFFSNFINVFFHCYMYGNMNCWIVSLNLGGGYHSQLSDLTTVCFQTRVDISLLHKFAK
jgi:hypothetical protein